MQLVELTEAFLSAMQHTFRANTRRAYRYDLQLFARAFPDLEAAVVTAAHLRAFLVATAERASSTRGPAPGHAALLLFLGLSE